MQLFTCITESQFKALTWPEADEESTTLVTLDSIPAYIEWWMEVSAKRFKSLSPKAVDHVTLKLQLQWYVTSKISRSKALPKRNGGQNVQHI